jgi:hypothetical protein
MMRNYRPDLIPTDGNTSRYVDIVDVAITYSSRGVKNDRPEKHFFQNILANGGVCGRRAFFGRFILRAFGVPTARRKEPGHATLAHWSPEGWKTRLGDEWGGRTAVGRTQMPRYGKGMHFVANAQARENRKDYIKVKRAQWIGSLMGEQPIYGRFLRTEGKHLPVLGFWHAVALAEQQQIIDALGAKVYFSKGSHVPPPVDIPEAARTITVDDKGVITIPAAACSSPTDSTKNLFKGRLRDGIVLLNNNHGDGLLHLARYSRATDTFAYTFDAPKSGEYQLTARLVTPTPNQTISVSANGKAGVTIDLPDTVGMWGATVPVGVELAKGENTLTFTGPARMTVKQFLLKPTN